MIFYGHLGLGDHLILNGLVRELAKKERVIVLCKPHNAVSCRFMWRDNTWIKVHEVADDVDARENCAMVEQFVPDVVRNGMHKVGDTFDFYQWDKEFYRHAGLDFDLSWRGFKVDRDLRQEETTLPVHDYAFIHDDPERGYVIDESHITKGLVKFRPNKLHPNLFTWCEAIERATEIHCIESCFAILADRIPTTATRLVVHAYVRKSIAPTYKKSWEVLR